MLGRVPEKSAIFKALTLDFLFQIAEVMHACFFYKRESSPQTILQLHHPGALTLKARASSAYLSCFYKSFLGNYTKLGIFFFLPKCFLN